MDELPMQRLDAYKVALELAKRVHEAGIRDSELRDQATRASKSTFLQLCEGLPLEAPGMRRKYFACANGSLHETIGAVDLARAIGAIESRDAVAVQVLGGRLKAMLRGLLR